MFAWPTALLCLGDCPHCHHCSCTGETDNVSPQGTKWKGLLMSSLTTTTTTTTLHNTACLDSIFVCLCVCVCLCFSVCVFCRSMWSDRSSTMTTAKLVEGCDVGRCVFCSCLCCACRSCSCPKHFLFLFPFLFPFFVSFFVLRGRLLQRHDVAKSKPTTACIFFAGSHTPTTPKKKKKKKKKKKYLRKSQRGES